MPSPDQTHPNTAFLLSTFHGKLPDNVCPSLIPGTGQGWTWDKCIRWHVAKLHLSHHSVSLRSINRRWASNFNHEADCLPRTNSWINIHWGSWSAEMNNFTHENIWSSGAKRINMNTPRNLEVHFLNIKSLTQLSLTSSWAPQSMAINADPHLSVDTLNIMLMEFHTNDIKAPTWPKQTTLSENLIKNFSTLMFSVQCSVLVFSSLSQSLVMTVTNKYKDDGNACGIWIQSLSTRMTTVCVTVSIGISMVQQTSLAECYDVNPSKNNQNQGKLHQALSSFWPCSENLIKNFSTLMFSVQCSVLVFSSLSQSLVMTVTNKYKDDKCVWNMNSKPQYKDDNSLRHCLNRN